MASPERVYDRTRSFLRTHPDCEGALEEMLTLDREGAWSFDDTSLDSGRFGTLVSEGIVAKSETGYRLDDRAAIEAALRGEPLSIETSHASRIPQISLSGIDWTAVGGLLAAIALVVGARSVRVRDVFRDGYVVSPANDPYFYRWMQHELLDISASPTDLSPVTAMPARAATRPFTHAMNWWLATVVGGTPEAADTVAAWLPVVGTIPLAIVLYLIAVRLTSDPRIGVVAVGVLAITPIHAVYTGMGFLEHRVHQYLWLGVMVLCLVWLAVDLHRRMADGREVDAVREHVSNPAMWVVVLVLGIAIAISVHAWRGSPMHLVPIGAYLAVRTIADVRRGVTPLGANLPVFVGVGGGALLAYLPHVRWGWHQADPFIVFAPLLVFIGGVTYALIGEAWRRIDAHPGGLVLVDGVVTLGAVWLFIRRFPTYYADVRGQADLLLFREDVAEVMSLFSPDVGVIFGPLFQLGLVFYLAIPVLGYVSWVAYHRYEPGYLVVVTFAWYYLGVAAIQVRFAAQLAIFFSFFAAIALVALFAWIDIARWPTLFSAERNAEETPRDGRTPADDAPAFDIDLSPTTVGIVLLVGGLLLFANVAALLGFMGQVTHDESFEAAAAIDAYLDEHPTYEGETHVLSNWGDNRMYNFFVNMDADNYGIALHDYGPFIGSDHPDGAYDGLADRVGFVVIEERGAPPDTTQRLLEREFGAGDAPAAHYRLIFATESLWVYHLVTGAELEMHAGEADAVTVATTVAVDDLEFEYARTVNVDEDGIATVVVPYAGTYTVGDTTVAVDDEAVFEGETITVEVEDG